MTVCYFCGREGTRGFIAGREYRPVCSNREACQRRHNMTTPSAKLAQIRGLVSAPWHDTPAALVQQIRHILEK